MSTSTSSDAGRAESTEPGLVVVTFPGRAEYLRLARLAAADCGARAGLSISELEDLRIGVDELAYALMGDGGDRMITLRYQSRDGVVEVVGECPGRPERGTLALTELARSIMCAVVDEHEISHDDAGTWRFRLVKQRRL